MSAAWTAGPDACTWSVDPTTANDELLTDNAYGTCPSCGPWAVFRLCPFWCCTTCGAYPDGPVRRPTAG